MSGIVTALNWIWPFLLVLGVLVFVHELGHFIVARLYGVRVHTFSLGFGPKLLKFTRGGTEYCISVIPLGGYVKLAGETVQDAPSGAPDEFLSKSKWIRFQVYLAGPVMNVLLAIVVLALVLSKGADIPLYSSAPAVVGAVLAGSAAERAGIKAGDRIVTIDGREVPTWTALNQIVIPRANRELAIAIDRQGQRIDVKVVPTAETKYELGYLGVAPVLRPEVLRVQPGSPAEKAGLRRNDVFLAVDGTPNLSREEIIAAIRKKGAQPVVFRVERDGQPLDITIMPEGAEGSSTVGAFIHPAEFEHVDPTIFQALALSVQQNWDMTKEIGRTLGGLFTRETSVKQFMGPVAIAELSGSAVQLGWLYLFELMASISLSLGLLNLLPVPVLDGGQIAILAVEGLFRRDMSFKLKERILLAGVALILLLMVTVIFNDVTRLLK